MSGLPLGSRRTGPAGTSGAPPLPPRPLPPPRPAASGPGAAGGVPCGAGAGGCANRLVATTAINKHKRLRILVPALAMWIRPVAFGYGRALLFVVVFVLENLRVICRVHGEGHADFPILRERFRIRDHRFISDGGGAGAGEAFDDMQFVAVKIARGVEP